MRELVIVAADLQPQRLQSVLKAPVPVALATLARFATARRVPDGWRSQLARHVGQARLAPLPPASLAAAGLTDLPRSHVTAWVATPVHLLAGLTSVHMDAGSVLRLTPDALGQLAWDFNATFTTTGYALVPLADSGEFLLTSAGDSRFDAGEPGLQLGSRLAQPKALERIGSEIEMWLHAHPLNAVRTTRGERPISALWLWGRGRLADTPPVQVARLPAAFAADAFVAGLWRSAAQTVAPVPAAFAELLPGGADDIVIVMEIWSAQNATRVSSDPLAALHESWLAPALTAVRAGDLQRLVLLAGAGSLDLHRTDLRKFWRWTRNPWQRLT